MSTLRTLTEKLAAVDAASYTTRDVAERIGCSQKTITRMTVPGRFKVGRLTRYVRPIVDAWIAAGCPGGDTRPPAAD